MRAVSNQDCLVGNGFDGTVAVLVGLFFWWLWWKLDGGGAPVECSVQPCPFAAVLVAGAGAGARVAGRAAGLDGVCCRCLWTGGRVCATSWAWVWAWVVLNATLLRCPLDRPESTTAAARGAHPDAANTPTGAAHKPSAVLGRNPIYLCESRPSPYVLKQPARRALGHPTRAPPFCTSPVNGILLMGPAKVPEGLVGGCVWVGVWCGGGVGWGGVGVGGGGGGHTQKSNGPHAAPVCWAAAIKRLSPAAVRRLCFASYCTALPSNPHSRVGSAEELPHVPPPRRTSQRAMAA